MRKSPWTILVVLALAQFMDVLDVTIVNVALPSIQKDLHFSGNNLTWVISAYTLLYGGFLLLGGRAADLLGRRRMFLAGLALFGASSLAAGLAPDGGLLIALRASQGLGAAFLAPAAFSILTVTFAAGRERNIAMGIWGGLAGLGGTLGVVFGGALVDGLSWRWIFLVNVPVVIALLIATPFIVPALRSRDADHASFDVAGAILGTTGVMAIVLGVIRAEPAGWTSGQVLGLLGLGVVLLLTFARVELTAADPLLPPSLLRARSLSVGSGALALNGAGFLTMFFLTALFLQQVRHLSPLATGVDFLPMGGAAIVGAVVASNLVTTLGTRTVQLSGTVLSTVGLLLLSRMDAGSSYASTILPGLVIFGVGIVSVGIPTQISAVADIEPHRAGTAGGIVTTAYQIGGALGLAAISTVSTSHAAHRLAAGASGSDALTSGYHLGILLAAGLSAVNVVFALRSSRVTPTPELMAELVSA